MIRIKVSHLTKKFMLDVASRRGALAGFLSLLQIAQEKQERHALQDVSLEVHAGEIVGLIGRNGSGKTTLLRVLGGIYFPDEGNVELNGKAVYLAGFSQGLIPKLTMRENIQLIGALHGLSLSEMKLKFDEIVTFSGLENYVDVKIYQFSHGMTNRLGFSATIHSVEKHNPDILLIDEALSGPGDIDFQEKAIEKLHEFVRNRAAVILAGHKLGQIQRYCQKAIWLENGRIQESDNAREVVQHYVSSLRTRTVPTG